jgi:addiction module RelB/DinJ family antitoxin
MLLMPWPHLVYNVIMSTIHLRVPSDLKKAAQDVAEANGLDLSTCIRMFLKQMEVRGALPIAPLSVNGFTEAEEAEILVRSRGPMVAVKSVKEALRLFRSA